MVTASQREAIRRAYHFQCGYFSVHENDVGSVLEIDHFQPLSSGGTDEDGNLVYACSACNKAKGDFWPPSNAATRLLHPKRDALDEHMQLTPDDHLNRSPQQAHCTSIVCASIDLHSSPYVRPADVQRNISLV